MSDTRPLTNRFLLPPTLSAPRLARQRVAAVCSELGADEAAVAELLTGELTTNAVLHPEHAADGLEPAILVEITLTERLLRVEVSDHDSHPLPPVRAPEAPGESGLGLHLVSQLSAAWGSYSQASGEGKVVWFEMAIDAQDRAVQDPCRDGQGGQ